MTRLLYILIMSILSCCACSRQQETEHQTVSPSPDDAVSSLVLQVQKCSRIYTTEMKIHKIVTHDDVIRLKGTILAQDFNIRMPLGDRKIAIPMDATLKAYIDLSDFSEKNVEHIGQKIIITLPDPQVILTSSKIDQKGIREFVGLVRSHFTDEEMANYEQQGRASMIESIPRLGIIPIAQENAARVLIPLIMQMGYQEQDIIIQFRKEYGLEDIKSLVNLDIEHDKK